MTGFGRDGGTCGGMGWVWEMRSVNGRGLDLRLRLPPGFEALEPALRSQAGLLLRRGTVTANLQVQQEARARLLPDPAALDAVLQAALALAARIPGAPPPRAEALLSLPGVLRGTPAEPEQTPDDARQAAVRAGFASALAALADARAGEGARLQAAAETLLTEIAALCATARAQAADQPARLQARLQDSLRALLGDTVLSPERLAQEVALLATRADVREELDRLDAHIAAARALLAEGAGVGRRLDFLVQEFMREANTLCSKSTSQELTATGLALKAAIEQLREQAQNVE